MTHSLRCGDVIPGCAAVFTASTQDELLGQVASHAAEAHDLTNIDDATLDQVKSAITTE